MAALMADYDMDLAKVIDILEPRPAQAEQAAEHKGKCRPHQVGVT